MKKRFFCAEIITLLILPLALGLAGCDTGTGGSLSGIIGENLALGKPDVTVTAESSSAITISWSAVPDAEEYHVYRSASKDSGWNKEPIVKTRELSYRDSGLSADTTYWYSVAAWNSDGAGDGSTAKSATTEASTGGGSTPTTPTSPTTPTAPNTPGTPTNVRAFVSGNNIAVNWDFVSNCDGYYVYRTTNALGTYTRIGKSDDRYLYAYYDYDIKPNTIYYYKVSAYNSAGESPQSSSPASVSTPASSSGGTSGAQSAITAPTSLTTYNFPSGQDAVWFKWTRVINDDRYLYMYDREYSSTYTGDIAYDTYYSNLSLIDANRPTGAGQGGFTYSDEGTYYIKIKPMGGYSSNKGSFALGFLLDQNKY